VDPAPAEVADYLVPRLEMRHGEQATGTVEGDRGHAGSVANAALAPRNGEGPVQRGLLVGALPPRPMGSGNNREWNASTTSSRRKVPRRRYARSGVWERVCASRCAPHPSFMACNAVPISVSTCPSAYNSGGGAMLQSVPLARIEPIKIEASGETLMSVSIDRYLSEIDDRSETPERVFEIFELADA